MRGMPRGVRVGIVTVVGAGILVGLRLVGSQLAPTPRPSATPLAYPSASPSGAFAASNLIGIGQGLGVSYQLGAFQIERVLCLDLAVGSSVTGSCTTLPATDVAPDPVGTAALWLGPLPSQAIGAWAELVDGRVIQGELFDFPTGSDIDSRAYVIQVPNSVDGVVVAFARTGRMVGSALYSTGIEPDRPVAVLDGFGNVIGYQALNDFIVFTPADGVRHSDKELRPVLRTTLLDARPEIRAWWRARPALSADPAAIARWWYSYPLHRTLEDSGLAIR
jgi:hypothetical protein